jgi:hypothetical protein
VDEIYVKTLISDEKERFELEVNGDGETVARFIGPNWGEYRNSLRVEGYNDLTIHYPTFNAESLRVRIKNGQARGRDTSLEESALAAIEQDVAAFEATMGLSKATLISSEVARRAAAVARVAELVERF